MATFFEVVTAAINDLVTFGYDTEERVAYWVDMLRNAAQADMVSELELEQQLRRVLQTAYERLVEKGTLLQHHQGVSKFTLDWIRPKLRGELDRRIVASANLIKLNREQTVADTLRRFQGWATSIPIGGIREPDRKEIKNGIRKDLRGLPYRERRVLIDQAAKLNASISAVLAGDNEAIAAQWRSHFQETGYNFRPDHRARDSRYKGADWVYAIRGNWAIQQGLMKAGEAGYTDTMTQPAEEVYCLPGSTPIPFADGVEVAYRRWYSGDLTEVVTASGKTLRATPNHPVLTSNGWVAIGALYEGDNLMEVADQIIKSSEADKHHAIPAISQIFSALRRLGVSEVRGGKREQFHGDGTNSDIDIVWTDRPLRFSRYATVSKAHDNISLPEAALSGSSASPFDSLGIASLTAAPRLMRGGNEALASIGALARHADDVGFAAVADRHTIGSQTFGEISPRRSKPLSQRQDAFPREVRSARIVKVNRRFWSGHVFNLQTMSGWYIAEGFVTHNCRCYYRYIYNLRNLPDAMLTAKGREALS